MKTAYIKNAAGKATRILVAALLAFAAVPIAAHQPEPAYAAGGSVQLSVGSSIYYDAYETSWFSADGEMAYCANPSAATPGSGTYSRSSLNAPSGRTEELAADLWFSYGSPGFDKGLWPSTWYDGTPMNDGRYAALAHILVADTFASDGNYAMYGCSEGFRDWVQQYTLGFGDTGQVISGNAAGRRIYERRGEVPESFEPYMIHTGTGTQVIVSFAYTPKITVKLQKTSSKDWSLSDKDYSLSGATYGVYASKADAESDTGRLTTMVAGDDGKAESEELEAGKTYYCKEVKAPAGYTVDGIVYEVSEGNSYSFTAKDNPITVEIAVAKLDKETGQAVPQGDGSLDGAEYTVSYDFGGELKSQTATIKGGKATFSGIPLGSVTVREDKAPEGYLLDTASHKFDVTADMVGHEIEVFKLESEDGFAEQVVRGGLVIGKGDAQKYENADGDYWDYAQGDATFEGAEFAIYNRSKASVRVGGKDFAKDAEVMRISTKRNDLLEAFTATTGAKALPYGTYEVVETKTPQGYTKEGEVKRTFQIREDGQMVQLVRADGMLNVVVRGGVMVEKQDKELAKSEALGGADHSVLGANGYQGSSLEGTEFTVTNASKHGVMVGDAWVGKGEVADVIYTKWNPEAGAYTAQTASDALPYGTYSVAETATNESYLLTDGKPRTFEVRKDGTVVRTDTAGNPLTWRNQVVRHDMHLLKTGETGDGKLALVPFLITNTTTGEAHVAVTDRNGMLNTSAGWRAHSASTNANDGLAGKEGIGPDDVVEGAGVWFGLGEDGSMADADDGLGALPYGEYTIQELRCEGNKGYVLWSDTFEVRRDTTATSYDIDLGTVDDEPEPRIGTTATDAADGDHKAVAQGKVTIVDEVEYANLVPGKRYTVVGTLMDKQTAEPVMQGEEPVTATAEFEPIGPFGKVSLTFEFDAEGMAGKSVVAFESLQQDGREVAVHADIKDEGQTVELTPPPEIGTQATDAGDGDHEASADAKVTIDDQVAYANLTPGKEYKLVGTLMDKETGEPVQSDGKPVTSEATFTPEQADGVAVVTFEFDGAHLADRETVAFEELYCEGKKVAVHADIEDEGQTVRLTPPTPEIGTTATDAADGDHEAMATSDVKIVDEVAYENLVPGREYKLVGTLIDRDDAKPVQVDGKDLVVETVFTPEEATGTATVEFAFDGTLLAGHRAVAFEELYDAEGKLVAEHKDPNDEGQTVKLVPPPIEIGTTATDADDGDHEVLADSEVVIDDEVRYKGLVPGKEYTMTGILMDKQTGKAVQQDGKDLTSTVSFKPDKPEGSVKVTFKFDGGKLAGHTTVAFESLKADGIELAVHADIEDEDQTVKLVEPPKEQPKQPTPEPETPTTAKYTPTTGDEVSGTVLAVLALGSCLALGLALYALRRSRRKNSEEPLGGSEGKGDDATYWRRLYGGE